MASSRNITCSDGFKLTAAVTVSVLFFLTFVPKSVMGGGDIIDKERKTVLGSRPPGCVNKCLNCRPCLATLVVPSHQKIKRLFKVLSSHEHERHDHDHDRDHDDDGYYLLSWKCRCGNKLFQP